MRGRRRDWLEGGMHKDWQHRKVFCLSTLRKGSKAAGSSEGSKQKPPLPRAPDYKHKDMSSSTPQMPRGTRSRPLQSSSKTSNLPFLCHFSTLQGKQPSFPFFKDWHHRTILKNNRWIHSGSKTKRMLPPGSKEALWWQESFWGLRDTALQTLGVP